MTSDQQLRQTDTDETRRFVTPENKLIDLITESLNTVSDTGPGRVVR